MSTPVTAARAVGEQRRAEALAAAEIEHAAARHERLRPQVAVVVLVDHLDVRRPRHDALSGRTRSAAEHRLGAVASRDG